MLDNSYDYVLDKFKVAEEEKIIADEKQTAEAEAAVEELQSIKKQAAQNVDIVLQNEQEAEKKYRSALEKIKERFGAFSVTRKEIAQDIRDLNNADIEVCERQNKLQLPLSLKYKQKTYAMLHGTDVGIFMVLCLSGDYAQELEKKTSRTLQSKFFKGSKLVSHSYRRRF